jgi:hypothetical protein
MFTIPCHNGNHNPVPGYTPLTQHQLVPPPAVIPAGPALLPEAPCSITLRVPVPGHTDQALITGRGWTPAEAVAQWQASRDALMHALVPETVLPSRDDLMQRLIGKAVVKAATAGDLDAVTRLGKAVQLVQAGAVEPGEREGTWAVRSSTDPLTWYPVEGRTCTCKDWTRAAQKGEERPCKHLLAVALHAKLQDAAPF